MSCAAFETLAARADGVLEPERAKALARHVAGCGTCAAAGARVDGLVAALRAPSTPAGDPSFVRDVMRRARSPRPSGVRGAAFLGVLAGCAAVLALALREPSDELDGVQSRGGSPATVARAVGFEAFVHAAPGAPVLASLRPGARFAAGSGLSFTLYNRTGAPLHYMLFAVDARREVHWFYPAFDGRGEPHAALLGALPQVVPLPEGVTPEAPASGPLQVVGLFLREAPGVREVEGLIAGGGLDALGRAFPGAVVQEIEALVPEETR